MNVVTNSSVLYKSKKNPIISYTFSKLKDRNKESSNGAIIYKGYKMLTGDGA